MDILEIAQFPKNQVLQLETEAVLPAIRDAINNPTSEKLASLLYLTANNPVVFIETFCTFPKVGSGIKLNKAQKLLLRSFYNKHYVYTIGSRQVGKSTAIEGLTAQLIAHYSSYPVYFATLTDKQATDNYNNIRGLLESLPKLWPSIGKPSMGRRVTLTNGSYFIVVPLQRKTDVASEVKGLSPYTLIVDEFPNIKRNKELLAEAVPALQTRFIIAKQSGYPHGIILSGNAVELGSDNALYAYKLWMQTVSGKTQYVPIVFYYRDLLSPQEAENIIRTAIETGMTKRDILIGYECVFLPAQNALLTDDILQHMQPRKPVSVIYPNHPVSVYLYETPDKLYETFVVIGVDTATMYGEDYYTISGVDFFTHEQLFEWHAKVPIDEVIQVLTYIATHVAPHCTVAIERNQGEHLIEFLLAQNPSFWQKRLYKTREGKTKQLKYGFWTDRRKKKVMFSVLVSELQKNPKIVASEELYKELLLVQAKPNGQIGVDPHYGHDDAVMAFAIALYVSVAEEAEILDWYADEIMRLPKFKEQLTTVEPQEIDKNLLKEIDEVIAKEKHITQERIHAQKEAMQRARADELLEMMFGEQSI